MQMSVTPEAVAAMGFLAAHFLTDVTERSVEQAGAVSTLSLKDVIAGLGSAPHLDFTADIQLDAAAALSA